VNTKSVLTTAAIALAVVIAHQKVTAGGGLPGVRIGA
jgi:hypothetical protein